MGKTGRWFRRLLTGKKTGETNVSDTKPAPAKEKSKWSFVRSFKDKSSRAPVSQSVVNVDERKGSYREGSSYSFVDSDDQSKHAIAVAAATAAVAEAAVAAAQAAAAVVRLTSSGRCTTAYGGGNGGRMEDWAVVKIQATFRGYLARRALRALKGLVKLQALVRGHIVRKRTAEELRCLQALVRAQARARAGRAHLPETGHPIKQHPSLSHYNHHHHPGPATPEKYEHVIRSNSARHDQSSPLKRSGSKNNSRDAAIDHEMAHLGWNWWNRLVDERSWDHRREFSMKTGPTDDEKSDKILEIDTGKPNFSSKRRNIHHLSQHTWASDRNSHSYTTMDSPSKDSTTAQQSNPSLSSGEVQSLSPLNFPQVVEDTVFSTAHNSPQFFSASSRPGSAKRGPFTPSKSDTRSFLSGYSDYPNYMANTESSKAKVRSHSAPKQRPEFEKSSSTKRLSVHGFGDMRSSAQKASTLHASFTSKAYPGSGRLDRLGMPIRGETIGYNDVYCKRY